MSGTRIALVTGGAGFIGSHMVDVLLDQGYCVRVIDNLIGGREENLAHLKGDSRVEVELRDIRSYAPDDVFFRGVEHVIHFAGIGDIVPSIEVVRRPAKLIRVARGHHADLFWPGSGAWRSARMWRLSMRDRQRCA